MAIARVAALRRRGVRPVVIDPQRTILERAFDMTIVAVFVFWVYLIVDYTDPPGPRWLPESLDGVLFEVPSVKWLGAAMLAAGVALYAVALRAMGDSWRMGIDRAAHEPGAGAQTASLVTTGLFARSRNPIYVAFDLIFLGSVAIHARVVLLIMAAALVLLFHLQILREERFLAGCYGERFADYRRRVRRYI